ncbi:MAG: flagellin [Planctomycetota bacterium]
MSRINTNVSSLLSQRILGQNNNQLTQSLERLSTGLRINRGSDDPAGLIASESLRSEQASISAALTNATRAEQLVNVAEGGLQEVNSLLTELQGLVSQSASEAGLSDDERNANQAQIDGILQTIDRIASTTSFNGTQLLNGSFDFTVSNQTDDLDTFQINAANVPVGNLEVEAVVTASAQQAGVFISLGATSLDLSTTNPEFVFEVAGADGSQQFSFASGATLDSIATAVNASTGTTGVSAIVSGNVVRFNSTEFGSSQFVAIDIINDGDQGGNVGVFNSTDPDEGIAVGAVALSAVTNAIRDEGQDVGVTVNGVTAQSDGRSFSITTDNLDLQATLTTSGVQSVSTIDLFTVTGGGARFNLGAQVNDANAVALGLPNIATRNLGFTTITNPDTDTNDRFATVDVNLDDLRSGGLLNVVDGEVGDAQAVVDRAVNQISSLRGRLGAFQSNTIGSTINSLGVALENISAAESAIRDTDFAAETAELTRSQVLVNAASSVLSIANNRTASALNLLG